MRMCSTSKHIISTNEDMQYEQDASSVQMRMCSTSKVYHISVRMRTCSTSKHIISTNEDMQYEQDASSVQMRMCSTSKVYHISVRMRMCSTSKTHHHYECGCAVQARWIIKFWYKGAQLKDSFQ